MLLAGGCLSLSRDDTNNCLSLSRVTTLMTPYGRSHKLIHARKTSTQDQCRIATTEQRFAPRSLTGSCILALALHHSRLPVSYSQCAKWTYFTEFVNRRNVAEGVNHYPGVSENKIGMHIYSLQIVKWCDGRSISQQQNQDDISAVNAVIPTNATRQTIDCWQAAYNLHCICMAYKCVYGNYWTKQ